MHYVKEVPIGISSTQWLATSSTKAQSKNDLEVDASGSGAGGLFKLNTTTSVKSKSDGRLQGDHLSMSMKVTGGDSSKWDDTKDADDQREWRQSKRSHETAIHHHLVPIRGLMDKEARTRMDEWVKNLPSQERAQQHASNKKQNASNKIIIGKDKELWVRQPHEEKGNYDARRWKKSVRVATTTSNDGKTGFWTYDHMTFEGQKPLKWGRQSYSGRLFIPHGVRAVAWRNWDGTNHFKTFEAKDHDEEHTFWKDQGSNRVCCWTFSVLEGFELERE